MSLLLYDKSTDMRFGINALSGLVRNKLGFDPMNGDVFILLASEATKSDFCNGTKMVLPYISKSWNEALLNVLFSPEQPLRVLNSASSYRG